MTRIDCYPWWHATFKPYNARGSLGRTVISTGCYVNSDGNIPCDPETMRAQAEQFMRDHGFNINLTLDEYSNARHIMSEVGDGTIEERVAVGEGGLNRCSRFKKTISQLMMPNGYYGPIHGVGTGTSTHPYGRWAATSQDPDVLAILIAQFVASGGSDNWSNADDQDGPEAWISKGQASLTGYVQSLAANGKYWVGPLPGVDPWHTFLQFTPDKLTRAIQGPMLLQRGIEALTLPRRAPEWSEDMPTCARTASSPAVLGALVGGLALGAWLTTRHIKFPWS